jgi:hypothetical protein
MILVLRRFAVFRLFPTFGFQIIIESRSTEDLPGLESDKCLSRKNYTSVRRECKHYLRGLCENRPGWSRLEPASSVAVAAPGARSKRAKLEDKPCISPEAADGHKHG